MALLHRVRRRGSIHGLSHRRARRPPRSRALRFPWVALMLGCLLAPFGCREREAPNLNPPDALLQDSLGLSLQDRVHRVVLSSTNGSERIDPREVVVEPGHFVEFFTQDRRVRTVSFVMDSLSAEQADFLTSTGQDRSPPLVELETRYVVSFRDAPEGRYPFLVEGNERTIPGVVVVGGAEPEG